MPLPQPMRNEFNAHVRTTVQCAVEMFGWPVVELTVVAFTWLWLTPCTMGAALVLAYSWQEVV